MELSIEDINRFIGRYSIGRDSNPRDLTGSPHFLRIKVPGGYITTNQLRHVNELVQKYSRGRAEITTRQDIQLHWIEADDSLEIFSILDKLGFTTETDLPSYFLEVAHTTSHSLCPAKILSSSPPVYPEAPIIPTFITDPLYMMSRCKSYTKTYLFGVCGFGYLPDDRLF